ncbi:hypothetical protein H6F43_00435 [Leptolyngbya sp. FACHB-36]|uniref:hypothetical protein n=1 Tax=Leptolyngbya sp. FACHB-36 TaxID=2692808 RepID=UPI001680B6EC|nr:hypothetical protein [Leptolyngbya sp. FACHB-36]MBD2018651.1 hypothetical protein [Leptolyngbya sp. FACHB-36]
MSDEVNQQLEVTAPLIAFFGTPEKEQIAILPVLEERKYDFPEGDLITSNALEILVNGYKACLNSILIRLMTIQDESVSKSIKDLVDLVERLLETTRKILEEHFEVIGNANSLGASEWESLRQLSLTAQRKLEIQLVVNTKTMKDCVEYWLHS